MKWTNPRKWPVVATERYVVQQLGIIEKRKFEIEKKSVKGNERMQLGDERAAPNGDEEMVQNKMPISHMP